MRLLFVTVAAQLLVGAAPPEVDWSKINPEILQHFSSLIRIDTSNPPGNETKAANYLKAALAREGISSKLLALEPSRANLVARIPGNGKKGLFSLWDTPMLSVYSATDGP